MSFQDVKNILSGLHQQFGVVPCNIFVNDMEWECWHDFLPMDLETDVWGEDISLQEYLSNHDVKEMIIGIYIPCLNPYDIEDMNICDVKDFLKSNNIQTTKEIDTYEKEIYSELILTEEYNR